MIINDNIILPCFKNWYKHYYGFIIWHKENYVKDIPFIMNKIFNAYNIYSQAKDSDLVGMQWGSDISILKTLQVFSGAARHFESSAGILRCSKAFWKLFRYSQVQPELRPALLDGMEKAKINWYVSCSEGPGAKRGQGKEWLFLSPPEADLALHLFYLIFTTIPWARNHHSHLTGIETHWY